MKSKSEIEYALKVAIRRRDKLRVTRLNHGVAKAHARGVIFGFRWALGKIKARKK